MNPKKGYVAAAETEAERTNISTEHTMFSGVIKVTATGERAGGQAIFELNQKLYDSGNISKELYMEIEAITSNFLAVCEGV
ncbi:MAG TPA: hypothetical protein C5S50_02700 [Methanosarcinaceae archaeon]|nr:hypothetical protein [Methanosarcinaceae archaeon]